MSVIEIKRKRGESFEAMFRRYSNRVKQSGKHLDARFNQFFSKNPERNKRRTSKLRGLKIAEKRTYLLRSGRITEESLRSRRGRRR